VLIVRTEKPRATIKKFRHADGVYSRFEGGNSLDALGGIGSRGVPAPGCPMAHNNPVLTRKCISGKRPRVEAVADTRGPRIDDEKARRWR
jgi:hypothetical protein